MNAKDLPFTTNIYVFILILKIGVSKEQILILPFAHNSLLLT